MRTFLELVLSLSAAASVPAVLLLLAGKWTQVHMSRRWQYYVWLIVIVRFLLPVGLPFDGGAVNTLLRQAGSSLLQEWGADPVRTGSETAQTADQTWANTSKKSAAQVSVSGQEQTVRNSNDSNHAFGTDQFLQKAVPVLAAVLFTVWLIAALVLFFHKIMVYQSFVRCVRKSTQQVSDETIFLIAERMKAELHLKKDIHICGSTQITTPMLVGAWRPLIVLPKALLTASETDLYHIFLHEGMHYKCCDLYYKWLVQLAVCVHWFNPLIYIIRDRLDQYCELACDEAVIRSMTAQERRSYGETLLSCVNAEPGCRNRIVSLTLNEEARLIKERLGGIMRKHKMTGTYKAWSAAATAMLLVIGILCGCMVPALPTLANNRKGILVRGSVMDADHLNTLDELVYPVDGYYVMDTLFKNGYIMNVAYNVDLDKYPVRKVVNWGGISTVGFVKATAGYADNAAVMNTFREVLVQLKAKNEAQAANYSIKAPVLLEVADFTGRTADELCLTFYKENNMEYFPAVAKVAGTNVIDQVIREAYRNEQMDYLAIVGPYCSDQTRKDLMELAYKEDKVDYFSVLSDYMKPGSGFMNELLEKAYKDGSITFFSCAADQMDAATAEVYARKSWKDDQLNFFSLCTAALSQQTRYSLGWELYDSNDINYFYILADELTDVQKKEFSNKAQKDGKITFYSVLND